MDDKNKQPFPPAELSDNLSQTQSVESNQAAVSPEPIINGQPTNHQQPMVYQSTSDPQHISLYDSKPKKKIRIWHIIVGVFVLLAALVSVIALLANYGPGIANNATAPVKQVGNIFVNEITTNQPDAAYKLTSNAFQQSNNLNNFDNNVQELSSSIQSQPILTYINVSDVAGVGTSSASVTYKVIAKNGKTGTITLTLIKINDKWLIDTIKTST